MLNRLGKLVEDEVRDALWVKVRFEDGDMIDSDVIYSLRNTLHDAPQYNIRILGISENIGEVSKVVLAIGNALKDDMEEKLDDR